MIMDYNKLRMLEGMARVDQFDPPWREFVHRYGLVVADAALAAGIKDANKARHFVDTVRDHYLGHQVEFRRIKAERIPKGRSG